MFLFAKSGKALCRDQPTSRLHMVRSSGGCGILSVVGEPALQPGGVLCGFLDTNLQNARPASLPPACLICSQLRINSKQHRMYAPKMPVKAKNATIVGQYF